MHSIKAIRENPDFFKKKIEERNIKLNIDDLLTFCLLTTLLPTFYLLCTFFTTFLPTFYYVLLLFYYS